MGVIKHVYTHKPLCNCVMQRDLGKMPECIVGEQVVT